MHILFVNVAQEIMILSTFLVFEMKTSASSGKNVNAESCKLLDGF